MFGRLPHEIAGLPHRYHQVLRAYYFSTRPEHSDLPDEGIEDVDFDAVSFRGGPT
jgi:hypothetical protein